MNDFNVMMHQVRSYNRFVPVYLLLGMTFLFDVMASFSLADNYRYGFLALSSTFMSRLILDKSRLQPRLLFYILHIVTHLLLIVNMLIFVGSPGEPSIFAAAILSISMRMTNIFGWMATWIWIVICYVATNVFEQNKTLKYDTSFLLDSLTQPLIILAFALIIHITFQRLLLYFDQGRLDQFLHHRVSNILNNIVSGVIMTELDGEIIFFNRYALKLLNRDDNIDGKYFDKEIILLDIDDRQVTLEEITDMMQVSYYSDQLRMKFQNKKIINIQISISRIFPELGRDTAEGYIILINDITEQARTKNEHEEMLNVVSHELMKPLMNVQADLSSAVLNFNQDASFTAQVIQSTGKNVERLTDLIINIKALSSLGSQTQVSLVPLDNQKLFASINDEFTARAQNKNINFKLLIPDNLPNPVSDYNRLGLVIYNVVSNALRFTPSGIVAVEGKSFGVAGNRVEYVVNDSGPGMSDEQLAEIKNFATHDSWKIQHDDFKVIGLGLYVAFRIARSIQVQIDISRNESGGTQVIISVPAQVAIL